MKFNKSKNIKFGGVNTVYTYKRLYKQALKNPRHPYGPSASCPALRKEDNKKLYPFMIGSEYQLLMPKSMSHYFWYNAWNNKRVKIEGLLKSFRKGFQDVYVSNSNSYHVKSLKYLLISSAWLRVPNKKEKCSCSTQIIWEKGCQCGGD